MSVRVSVVVPTYRRPDLLRRCLAALTSQDFDPSAYEVIVVDDGPSEDIRRLVEGRNWSPELDGRRWRYGQRPGLAQGQARMPANGAGKQPRYGNRDVQPSSESGTVRAALEVGDLAGQAPATYTVSYEAPALVTPDPRSLPAVRYLPVAGRHGPAAARNLGWRAAQGELVAFTDDDCIPAPGWLRAGVAAFGEGVVGVSGRIYMPIEGTPTDYELDATGLARSEFVTANCFYRRSALELAGGFDESFAVAWREDTDIFFTLLEMGERAGVPSWSPGAAAMYPHVPEAIVVHPVRPAPWGISLRQQRRNLYNALLFKKHPSLYRQRIQVAPPWLYYASLAALLGGGTGMLAGQPRAGVAGLVLWAALTGRFCARRLRGTSHAPRHVAEMVVTSALIPPVAVFWRLAGAVKYGVRFL